MVVGQPWGKLALEIGGPQGRSPLGKLPIWLGNCTLLQCGLVSSILLQFDLPTHSALLFSTPFSFVLPSDPARRIPCFCFKPSLGHSLQASVEVCSLSQRGIALYGERFSPLVPNWSVLLQKRLQILTVRLAQKALF